jgi:hypothetical protein
MDLTRAEWRKSSRSGDNGGNCVEVARNFPGIVAIRDSKDPSRPVLTVSRDNWASFITRLRAAA